jgi:hypothetical protein
VVLDPLFKTVCDLVTALPCRAGTISLAEAAESFLIRSSSSAFGYQWTFSLVCLAYFGDSAACCEDNNAAEESKQDRELVA